MFKIMIVEDDQTISGLIADNLKKWQFDPVVVTDFNAVFDDFLQEKPHLVLLDINLPVFDGYYWVQKIREVSKAPVIFICHGSVDRQNQRLASTNLQLC